MPTRRYPLNSSNESKSSTAQRGSQSSARNPLVSIHPNSNQTRMTRSASTSTAGTARLTRSKSSMSLATDATENVASAGRKRKRVGSTSGGVGMTSSSSVAKMRDAKRRKRYDTPQSESTSSHEEDEDKDEEGERTTEDEDEEVATEEDEEDADYKDYDDAGEFEYWAREASKSQLDRRTKEFLLQLSEHIGIDTSAPGLTKPKLISSILNARSQSLRRYQTPVSTSSNDGGAEEGSDGSEIVPPPRKRARNVVKPSLDKHVPRYIGTTRSVSMGNLLTGRTKVVFNRGLRRSSARSDQPLPSSPSQSVLSLSPSPRKLRTTRTKPSGKGKEKAKHVGFNRPSSGSTDNGYDSDSVHVAADATPMPRRRIRRGRSSAKTASEEESDVDHDEPTPRATRPTRAARFKGSLAEHSTDEDLEEEEEDVFAQKRSTRRKVDSTSSSTRRSTRTRSVTKSKSRSPSVVEEEVDELSSDEPGAEEMEVDERELSPSLSPLPSKPTRKTQSSSRTVPPAPEKRSTRPQPAQTHTPPSDDNADDDEEMDEIASDQEVNLELEPRTLRNGKVVGDMVDEVDGDESMLSAVSEVEEDQLDGTEDEEDEVVDLTRETAQSLQSKPREVLVHMCEAYDLPHTGPKRKLVETLIGWRDTDLRSSPTEAPGSSCYSDSDSPSSVSTARGAPPTERPVNRTTRTATKRITPLLDKPQHIHISPPAPLTPVQSVKTARGKHKQKDEDVELNLEGLGLEDKKKIEWDDVIKQEKIGSGGFKDVFIGKWGNRRVAISEFRGTLNAMDVKELELLSQFNHPNVVKFYGVSVPNDVRSSSTPVRIIGELCANGDLFDYVRNVPAPSLSKVLHIMYDIARGIEYLHLHDPSIIHRDCKSSNVLITSKGQAKITDFGLAKVKHSTRSMVKSLVGTVNWQAPELWHAQPKYDHKVDVFSCAMVYWEILQWHLPKKTYPWEGYNEHAIYDLVGHQKKRPSLNGCRKQWCPEVVDLVEHMWDQEPKNRPTMTHVVRSLQDLIKKYS